MADKLLTIFSEVLDIPLEKLGDSISPENTSQWDSLAAMHLVVAIENALNVRLSTKEILQMNSIGAARKLLIEKGVSV
jgi:acyl carrier protein